MFRLNRPGAAFRPGHSRAVCHLGLVVGEVEVRRNQNTFCGTPCSVSVLCGVVLLHCNNTEAQETLGVCALVLTAEVCVWFAVCFAEGHCAWSDSTDLGWLSAQATLFPEGECDHARPQHFADQPRVTGNVDPELLPSPLCRECTLTTGLSPLEFPTKPRSILRNERDDSGHRGSSFCSQGLFLSSETWVSSVRRAIFGT